MPVAKPAVGRTLHIFAHPGENNGADHAPATITRVWSDTLVNVHVMPDGHNCYWRTSVEVFPSREAAEAKRLEMVEAGLWAANHVPLYAYWPPKV